MCSSRFHLLISVLTLTCAMVVFEFVASWHPCELVKEHCQKDKVDETICKRLTFDCESLNSLAVAPCDLVIDYSSLCNGTNLKAKSICQAAQSTCSRILDDHACEIKEWCDHRIEKEVANETCFSLTEIKCNQQISLDKVK